MTVSWIQGGREEHRLPDRPFQEGKAVHIQRAQEEPIGSATRQRTRLATARAGWARRDPAGLVLSPVRETEARDERNLPRATCLI